MKKGTIFAMLSAIALCASSIPCAISASARSNLTFRTQGNAVIRESSLKSTDYTFTYYGENKGDVCCWNEEKTDLIAVVLEDGTENFDPSAAIPGATLTQKFSYDIDVKDTDDVELGMFHQPSVDRHHFKDIFLSDFDENDYAIVSGASEQAEKLYELEGVKDVYRMTALFILSSGYIGVMDRSPLGESLTNEEYLDTMQQVREKIEANDAEAASALLPGLMICEIGIGLPNNYALTRVYEAEPTEITLGDVNFDGTVNLSDVILLRQAVSGSMTLSAPHVSDIDRDGVTDSNDAIALLRFLLRIDESIG